MKHYEKIKQIRESQNLTIADTYERGVSILGIHKSISQSTISRIETGKPHKTVLKELDLNLADL